MSFANAEADRRIANLVMVGRVTSISGNGTARVAFGDLGSADLPVMVQRAGAVHFWAMPSEGEQVVVASPSGDIAQAIIIGSIPAGNAPSSDTATPMLHLGGGKFVIVGDIEITGKVTVTEDVVADGVSLVHHTHKGVTTGSSNTGEPNGS